MFKVGDDVIRGTGYRGIVVSVRNRFDSDYPIVVLFENEEEITFTSEGVFEISNPSSKGNLRKITPLEKALL